MCALRLYNIHTYTHAYVCTHISWRYVRRLFTKILTFRIRFLGTTLVKVTFLNAHLLICMRRCLSSDARFFHT